MILFKSGTQLGSYLQKQRVAGARIGFVPTMGALHSGHLSLIERSRAGDTLTVCSIFVNPTQFNDPKDFRKYPVTLEKDMHMLEKAGTDVLFLPEVDEMYPGGMQGLEHYELGMLETVLEGKFRPGHFQGVCQAVRRLLGFVEPDDLFMGQKDYQQCMVVRRLLDLMGSPARLHTCPIIRESDGLAMSSRNLRLSESERKTAPVIFQTLSRLRNRWKEGRPGEELIAEAVRALTEQGLKVDYVEIADASDLGSLHEKDRAQGSGNGGRADEDKAIALVAAFLGEIRLIDNMLL